MISSLGRNFITGLSSTSLLDEEKAILAELKPLGIIFFARNFIAENNDKIIENIGNWESAFKKLLNDINEVTEGKTTLLSIDFEGGRVNRFPTRSNAPIFPYARYWAADSYRLGFKMASYLAKLGINLNYAPVLDLDLESTNPVIGPRSFSSNPEIVEYAAREFIRGSLNAGVLSCIKHFPGHGRTTNDSHFELPKLALTKTELELDILPFRNLIKDQSVSLLMTAHVIYEAFDSAYPASISRKIITDLLREELKFQGLVISDDFDMKALNFLDIEERAELMLKAGTDVILIGNGMTSNSVVQSYQIAKSLEQKIVKDHNLRKSIESSWQRNSICEPMLLSKIINKCPTLNSL